MSFIWIPVGILTNPYCKKLGLSHIATTFILMIGSIVGFIVPPFVAVWSDSCTFRYGRRRIWLVCGELMVFLGLTMTSFCREISWNQNGAIFYFVFGQILASVGGNIANGPGRTMCSDVVPAEQQVLVSNICMLDNAIAGVISNSIGALKLYQYTNLNNESFVIIVSCVIGLVAMIVSVVSTPEEPLAIKNIPSNTTKNPLILIIQSFKIINKNLFCVLTAFLFYSIGSIEMMVHSSNYVARYIFNGVPNAEDGKYDAGVSYAQFLSLVQTLFMVVFSFYNTKIVRKIGIKNTWILGMVSIFIANSVMGMIENKKFLLIPYILNGIAGVIGNSAPYAYVSLVAPPEKMASSITLIILFGNIGGILAQFVLTMWVGSFEYFAEKTSRLMSLSAIFNLAALFFGYKGYSSTPIQQKLSSEFELG